MTSRATSLSASFASILSALGCSSTTEPVTCGGCPCNAQPRTYSVTFTVCASDAGADAADGGDGGAACFASCELACQGLQPASVPGLGQCTSDAGVNAGETLTVSCEALLACVGRKTAGLEAPAMDADALGKAAWLEAAAVHAFERLARELHAHGAPQALVRRARASAWQEVRHARLLARLARKRGVEVPPLVATSAEDTPVRDLESIACENAVEGCVGETYGALQASFLAGRARDEELARTMGILAPDEIEHAALGWDVAAWIDGKLTPASRLRVRASRDAAARALCDEVRSPLADALMASVWS